MRSAMVAAALLIASEAETLGAELSRGGPAPSGDGVEVALSDYPDLAEPGGWALVDVPDALLHLVVAHTTPGCFVALWSICTHGACEVAWEADAEQAVCPCHDSRFDADGAVVEGPATEPLRAFAVTRVGDSLFIG